MPWQDRIKRDWDRPRQSVLAFEPNPDYAFFARWMLRDRAEVHEVALSDASGRGTLYVPLSDQGVLLHLAGSLKRSHVQFRTSRAMMLKSARYRLKLTRRAADDTEDLRSCVCCSSEPAKPAADDEDRVLQD